LTSGPIEKARPGCAQRIRVRSLISTSSPAPLNSSCEALRSRGSVTSASEARTTALPPRLSRSTASSMRSA